MIIYVALFIMHTRGRGEKLNGPAECVVEVESESREKRLFDQNESVPN